MAQDCIVQFNAPFDVHTLDQLTSHAAYWLRMTPILLELSEQVNEWLIQQNERRLIETLAFTVKDDSASLNGATVEDVRKLFTAWTESEEATAERQAAIDRDVLSSPRYTYCVHVDTEALEECLKYDALPEETQWKYINPNRDPALGQAAFVNIVEKVVPVYGNHQQDDEEDSEEEKDAISFKAHWPMVIPDIYNGLNQRHEAFQRWAQSLESSFLPTAFMNTARPAKRIRQACEQCRRKKSKCSGERPICSTCWRLDQQCFYNGEPLQPGYHPAGNLQNPLTVSGTPSQSPVQFVDNSSNLDDRMASLESTVTKILDTLQSNVVDNCSQSREAPALSSRITNSSLDEVPPLIAMVDGEVESDQVKIQRKREIEVLGEIYLKSCADQPLPLFPRQDFIKLLPERDDPVLFSIIANAIRHSGNTVSSTRRQEDRTFRDAAHSLVLQQIGSGRVGVPTLQALCLIVFYDYTSGNATASSLMTLTSMLAQSVDFRTRTPNLSSSFQEESKCCYWSIVLLGNLLGLASPSSMKPDSSSVPYPLSCTMPTRAVLRSSFRGLYEQTGPENGIMVFVVEMSKEWTNVMAYVRACLSSVSDVAPWLTTSRYAAAMAGVMSIETRLQPLHRYKHITFRDLTHDDLEGAREYWAPWFLSRFLYHTMVCLLNHPLIITLQLQANGNDSELFRQQSSFYVARHVRWILHFIAFIEAKDFCITDPILGYCASVVATIESQLSYSVDEATAEKKQRNIESCRRLICRLAPACAAMAELDQRLGTLSHVISNTYASNISRSASVSVDLSRVKQILDIFPGHNDIVDIWTHDLQTESQTTVLSGSGSSRWVRLSRRPSVDQPDDNGSPTREEGIAQITTQSHMAAALDDTSEIAMQPDPVLRSPIAQAYADFPADLYFNGISQNIPSWWVAFDAYDPDCPSF
ncbi:hypothetical protein OPT61_g3469 [Boeremia exigua]|uniref:Uncharacterized protein n=1 Tax=Boeremia exigua TaxID=749465 RepID=A0ACC2IHR6_9PLEO|nr:hypothetical protein OPT61_g3469 [Boeremia exigua]